MKVMALDYGDARTGVAISDSLGLLAGETAVLPILVGADENAHKLSMALLERGVFVPSAEYPAVPRGKARLRFCVTAAHKPEQIVEALDKLAECAEELGIALPRAQS